MTILKNFGIYGDYGFEALNDQVRTSLVGATDLVPRHYKPKAARAIVAFECLLQITDQRLSGLDLNRRRFIDTAGLFIGGLHCEAFFKAPLSRRYPIARAFLEVLSVMPETRSRNWLDIFPISTARIPDSIQALVEDFEAFPLNQEKVAVWTAWHVRSRAGMGTWLPLLPIYKRLGREFTEQLHSACRLFFEGRRADRICCLPELSRFIEAYPGHIDASYFQDAGFVGEFLQKFFVDFVENGYDSGNGALVKTVVKEWKGFIDFAEHYLVGSGLISPPFGQFPLAGRKGGLSSRGPTHLRTTSTGEQIHAKLLTDIPLEVTDTEAIQLLFYQIRADVDLIKRWARSEVDQIWQRFQRREQLTQERGAPIDRIPGAEGRIPAPIRRDDPDYLHLSAATLKHYGYIGSGERRPPNRFFAAPLDLSAVELGLPTGAALIPHCALLIAENPAITASFLETLELYGEDGQIVGLQNTDAGTYLAGYKYRRGPTRAKQEFLLNQTSLEIVNQIIALTAPLRNYLRKHKHDDWRYLLLTTGRGFGFPSRLCKVCSWTSRPEDVSRIAGQLQQVSNEPHSRLEALARKFSLTSLRASVAVLVYLETQSVERMARALGHAEYDPRLLGQYLPRAIQEFFKNRWIRIFQTGLIVEALRDSEYLLEGSGFDSVKSLHEFLENHRITLPDHPGQADAAQNQNAGDTPPAKEVIFGVNIPVLTALISLQAAVEAADTPVPGLAQYWAGITGPLVNYIESNGAGREDLAHFLREAREQATLAFGEALIYA